MKRIEKLHFLIHGFCHAEAAARGYGSGPEHEAYLACENERAERWRSRLRELSPSDALVVVPVARDPAGPAAGFHALASEVLGDRCFFLDTPMCCEEEFWSDESREFRDAVSAETEAAFKGQGQAWNKEELHTSLHCVALCRQLEAALRERGLLFAPDQATGEAWGASFDGCVTKYSVTFRRMLRLPEPVPFALEMTVPDARFLLDAEAVETVLLAGGLRLFLFRAEGRSIALYTATSHAMSDRAVTVGVEIAPVLVTVRSKQGIRLWPEREPYCLRNVPPGRWEAPQELVTVEEGALRVPVSYGFVYRLAKAPAYVFAGPELSHDAFRAALLRAAVVTP